LTLVFRVWFSRLSRGELLLAHALECLVVLDDSAQTNSIASYIQSETLYSKEILQICHLSTISAHLLSVPHPGDLRVPHLLLELKHAVHQSLRSRGAPRHINIHRHNPITTPCNTITIMVISATIRTASHRNNPSRIRHLIIHLSERRSHLVGKRARNDHDIGLARRSTEDYTETILIVARSR